MGNQPSHGQFNPKSSTVTIELHGAIDPPLTRRRYDWAQALHVPAKSTNVIICYNSQLPFGDIAIHGQSKCNEINSVLKVRVESTVVIKLQYYTALISTIPMDKKIAASWEARTHDLSVTGTVV